MPGDSVLGPRSLAVTALGGLAVASVAILWTRLARWGATDDEVLVALPGDEFLADPDVTTTRAVTVQTSPARVWPWIAQIGQGRAGFYTYEALENLVGCDIRNAEQIVAHWQAIEVGDQVRLHPEIALVVASVEPGRSLVLRGGVPIGSTPSPYEFTWAFVIRDAPDGTARLLVRERYRYSRPWAVLIVQPVQLVSFVMSRRMLHGIRDRAERARQTPISTTPI